MILFVVNVLSKHLLQWHPQKFPFLHHLQVPLPKLFRWFLSAVVSRTLLRLPYSCRTTHLSKQMLADAPAEEHHERTTSIIKSQSLNY